MRDLFAAGVQNYVVDEDNTLVVAAREGVLANDFDADGDVDLIDFDGFRIVFTGPM